MENKGRKNSSKEGKFYRSAIFPPMKNKDFVSFYRTDIKIHVFTSYLPFSISKKLESSASNTV
jgi:hypothetical protein